MFRSVVYIKWKDLVIPDEQNPSLTSDSYSDNNEGTFFSSESWEKNKRFSEQAVALVAINCLGVKV